MRKDEKAIRMLLQEIRERSGSSAVMLVLVGESDVGAPPGTVFMGTERVMVQTRRGLTVDRQGMARFLADARAQVLDGDSSPAVEVAGPGREM